MRRGIRAIVIGMVLVFILAYSPIEQYKCEHGVNSSNEIFGNESHVKWEYNHTYHGEMTQHNWTAKWQKKFNETSKEFKAKWRKVNNAFKRMAKMHAFIGKFSYENGYGVGNFVKFMFNDSDIVDYTVIRDENITVFDFVHVDNFHPVTDPVITGAVWRVKGENASIEIHDNPVALLKIKTAPSTITFYPSEGIDVKLDNSSAYSSAYLTGAINGTIILCGEGKIELSNISNVSAVVVRVEISKGVVLFLAEPSLTQPKNNHHIERAITKHIARGKVFARVLVNDTNSTDGMVFVNGSINCHTFKHRVKVEVNGTGEGKSVVIDVTNRVLKINNTNKLRVFVDGKEIDADNYTNVLNGTGIAKYAIINTTNGIIVIVHLPHFSTHTIEIYTEEERSATPGFEIVFVLLSILTAVILKRKNLLY